MFTKLIVVVLVGLFACSHCQYTQSKCQVGTTTVDASCRNNFTDVSQFWAFSTNHNFVPPQSPGTTVIGPGAKLLFDYRQPPAAPGFWFGDMTRYPSHVDFISGLGLTNAYNADPGDFYRCDFQNYVLANGELVFAYTYNYGAGLTERWMIGACNLSAAATAPIRKKYKLGFVSLDATNQPITAAARAYCENLGFYMGYISDILGAGKSDPYIPLHPGVTYGYFREFPNSSSILSPTDIPIFNQLPLDLSVVAGVMSTVFQTVNSHINLKSGERDTPNMVLLNYDQHPCLTNSNNKPVKFSVSSYGWSVENATDANVTAFYQAKLVAKQWVALYHDIRRDMLSFDNMCTPTTTASCLTLKTAYGTKGASLGYLRYVLGRQQDVGSLSNQLGYDLTPIGFGIPFMRYVDFINFPPNANLKDLINELTYVEMTSEPTPDYHYNMSLKIRQAFWNATVPPAILADIEAAVNAIFIPAGIDGVKLRSSSNSEDLPNFDGAGLYDSFSAKFGSKTPKSKGPCAYDESQGNMQPQTLECALKGVYGSLWNQRGIEERSFARFRHDTCVMGIAVVPEYKTMGNITGNAVGVTRLIDGNVAKPGYTYSLQDGDNVVTNPEPGTQSETSLAIIQPDKTWQWERIVSAIPTPGGTQLNTFVVPLPLMNTMMKVVLAVEKQYCLESTGFNLTHAICDDIMLNNVKSGLDMEFKFIDNFRVHAKQVREYTGTKDKIIDIKPVSCSYINPSYFPPVNNITYNNVALGRVPTSGTVLMYTMPFSNGASTQVSAIANKSTDGYVVNDYSSVTSVDNWYQVTFDLPYSLQYIRIFWCYAPISYTRPSSVNFIFTSTFVNGTSKNTTQTFTVASTNMQLFNLTRVDSVSSLTLTVATGQVLCFAEIQVLAPPYLTGNPADFPEKPFPATGNCSWSDWSSWGPCSYPCAGGTQNRTRGGQWCVNYVVLDVFEQQQTCNTFVCPVDCKWNEWGSWAQCSSCAWTTRSRTNVPPIGTGAQCTGPSQESMECLLNNIACPLAPPIELQVNIPSDMNVSAFTTMIGDNIAAKFNVDRQSVNVYAMPYVGNGSNYRLVISFNGVAANTSQPLPFKTQDALAEQLSQKLETDKSVIALFVNNSVSFNSVPDSALGGIGVASSETSSPTNGDGVPFYAWIFVGFGVALLIAGLIGLIFVLKHMSKNAVDGDMYAKL